MARRRGRVALPPRHRDVRREPQLRGRVGAARAGARGVDARRARARALLRVLARARAALDGVELGQLDPRRVRDGRRKRAGECVLLLCPRAMADGARDCSCAR